jgi:hypothetical protein
VLLGNTRHLRDSVVVDWEFGRIVESETGVTLWPYPRGVASPCGFPLVRAASELASRTWPTPCWCGSSTGWTVPTT